MDGMSSERVDGVGMPALAEAFVRHAAISAESEAEPRPAIVMVSTAGVERNAR
jgi:hypothetical protein